MPVDEVREELHWAGQRIRDLEAEVACLKEDAEASHKSVDMKMMVELRNWKARAERLEKAARELVEAWYTKEEVGGDLDAYEWWNEVMPSALKAMKEALGE